MSSKLRQAKLSVERREQGYKKINVWLCPQSAYHLEKLQDLLGYTATDIVNQFFCQTHLGPNVYAVREVIDSIVSCSDPGGIETQWANILSEAIGYIPPIIKYQVDRAKLRSWVAK